MKIALVTPLAVPLALGGAENLWWGLQSHFVNETEHDCDIVSVPSPEGSLVDLVESYETFFRLDLSAYDCVISGKYPGWMVEHPNHICYMLHRLRGLYDTYGGGGIGDDLLSHAPLRQLLRWMRQQGDAGMVVDRSDLAEFFDRFRALRSSGLPENALAFPGPVAREIIHFLDDAALSPGKMRSYAAISGTVARRRGYFPPQVPVDVLYPPPHRDDYRCGRDDYFFVSSRLDGPKRLDLVIRAMAHVHHDIPLLIAGMGPDERRLKALAGDDPRIRFLGFVPDDDMPGLYADALAVPFVPYDEDYGLITIEAMRSGKPVVTCVDSGGPCEFVREGQTGFTTRATPEAIGEKLDWLCAHRSEARSMGEAARLSVEPVNWQTVVNGLLRPAAPAILNKMRKPKLTVATTFPVWPPMGGGQARVFQLYKALTSSLDIDLVSLSSTTEGQGEREIAPGMVETRIPRSARHLLFEQKIAATVGDIPIGDITSPALASLTPDFGTALSISALSSEAVVACHPYLLDEIRSAAPDKPLWYEAQDVEIELKSTLLSGSAGGARLLEDVRKVEGQSWRSARHVFACAQRDLDTLRSLYGPTRASLHEVPNGVALDEIDYVDPARRRALKHKAGLEQQPVALFMGSWHGPNLEAVEDILKAADSLPTTQFIVVGSVGLPFRERETPDNVRLLGQVPAHVRNELLAVADVALNPMHSGSGTNLKMLDYFAAGIPVISTAFGARGLLAQADTHFSVVGEEGLAGTIDAFQGYDGEHVDAMVVAARRLVEEFYSWNVIADKFIVSLEQAGFGQLRRPVAPGGAR
ncbi:glycosyltransferase family 4 protein [Mesorhizobium sp. CAU 1741]|uniref:glycosyltransferase family 4 protein n=1 Tax=Mesorhizobium sp. CAU 1741 TaxID=3140366 RepID=UPI00325C01D4